MLFQRFGIGTDTAIVICELVVGFFDMAVEFDDIGVLMRQLAFNNEYEAGHGESKHLTQIDLRFHRCTPLAFDSDYRSF